MFADIKGNVALWQQGRFVNKWEQQGKFILDGANPEHAWQNFIPKRHSPHVYNPPRGYVSSANQHPTDTSYFYYYNGNFEFFRNRRINQQLSHKERIKPSDMMRLQNDNYNLMAAETLPLMLSDIDERSLNDSTEFKYYQLLSKWNYLNEADPYRPPFTDRFLETTILPCVGRNKKIPQYSATRPQILYHRTTAVGTARTCLNGY